MNSKVAHVVIRLETETLNAISGALADRSDAAMVSIMRPATLVWPCLLATTFTGTSPLRHDVQTLMVPRQNRSDDESPLRFRSSRDSQAAFLWDRLAVRGIRSLVVNLPLAPANLEPKSQTDPMQIPTAVVLHQARKSSKTPVASALGFLAGTIERNPEIRYVALTLDLRDKPGSGNAEAEAAPDTDPMDTFADLDDPTAAEDSAGDVEAGRAGDGDSTGAEQVLGILDFIQKVTGADHVFAQLFAARRGTAVLIGARASELSTPFIRIPHGAGVVLDLLGESVPVDVAGGNVLDQSADDDAGGRDTWTVEEVELIPVDWSETLRRVEQGEATPNEIRTVTSHFRSRFRVAYQQTATAEACDAARVLVGIDGSARHLLELATLLGMKQDKDGLAEIAERLRTDYPDAPETGLLPLIAGLEANDDEIDAILDEVPFRKIPIMLVRILWSRQARRRGRDEEAMAASWWLISAGIAALQDRIQFAKLAMARQQPGDARRAALVLRSLGTNPGTDPQGKPRSDLMVLRARALAASGAPKAAVSVLTGFLKNFPMEPKATAALDEIRPLAEVGS